MTFRITPDDAGKAVDRDEVARALEVLIGPGEHHELRGLGRSAGGQSYATSRLIHYGDWTVACDSAYEISGGIGVYYSLNPVDGSLGNKGASAKHVLSRRWLLVDVDRKKTVEPDQSATQSEKDAALSLGCVVFDWLISNGWPAPVLIDSGNGCHLLFRIDLPADRLSHLLIQRTLKALADRWSSPGAEIDPKVYDAPRIARLPGTWARKGISTAERPHRLCRILHVPHDLAIVTAEMLEAVAGDSRPTTQDFDPWKIKVPASVDRREAYVRSAFERELSRVALANTGNRNNQLNTAAFAIGQLVGAGALDRHDAEAQLSEAARRCGLSDSEAINTIRNGLIAGIADPRKNLPEAGVGPKVHVNGTAKTLPVGSKLITWASDIKPKKVEWLWPGRIPIGKMTTFAGPGGLGKTFVLLDIATRITRGMAWPYAGGECAEPGKVLFISGEDDEDDTLVPRLIEMGADRTKIAFLSTDAHDNFTMAALKLLTDVVDQIGDVRMVAIDPPTSYLGGVDDHKNSELRALLTPLKTWCAQKRVAVIMNNHVNKNVGQGIDAAGRVMGSVAWVNAVRAVHMFVPDPDVRDHVFFVPLKMNVAKRPIGLSYKIVPQPSGEAVVEWTGEIDQNADQALEKTRKKPRQVAASEHLKTMFLNQKEWTSEAFWLHAKEAGVSKNAIDEFRTAEGWPKCRRTVDPDGQFVYVWLVRPDFDGESITR